MSGHKLSHSLVLAALLCCGCAAAQPAPVGLEEIRYGINVELNDSLHVLHGNWSVNFINRSGRTLDTLYIHLYPNAYADRSTALVQQMNGIGDMDLHFAGPEDRGYIDSLLFRANGIPLQWNAWRGHTDVAWIALSEPLGVGDSMTLSTPFRVKIPETYSRLGHVGQSYQVSQWFPKLAMLDSDGWHPMPYLDLGEFYSAFADYHVTITLPANYLVAATGELVSESERQWIDSLSRVRNAPSLVIPPSSSRLKIIVFNATQVVDFAWFADKRFAVRQDILERPDGRTVTISAYFTAMNAELWEGATALMARATNFYSDLVGEYPYSTITAAEAPLSRGIAMEYPTLTLIGYESSAFLLDQVLAHEIGHNWFYGALATNERMYPWMDEGINSYYENRYLDSFYRDRGDRFLPEVPSRPHRYTDSQLMMYYRSRNRSFRPLQEYTQVLDYDSYVYGAYVKPALAFEMLEVRMGRQRLDSAMRAYYDQWKFGHPGPGDLRNVLEERCSCSLSWLFDATLGTAAFPDYKLLGVDHRQGNAELVNIGEVPAPVEIVGYRKDEVVHSRWFEGFGGRAILPFKCQDCDRIEVYRPSYSLDPTPENNALRTSGDNMRRGRFRLTFLGAKRDPDRRTLNVLPALGWNNYDKGLVGLYLSNLNWPPGKFEWSAVPMYGTASRTLTGLGNFRYTSGLGGSSGNTFSVNAGVKSFHFNRDPHYEFRDRYFKADLGAEMRYRSAGPTLWRHETGYRFTYVRQEYGQGVNFDTREWEQLERDYIVHEIRHRAVLRNPLRPFEVDLTAQAGSGFLRLSATVQQQFVYNKRNKRVYLRLFGGWLPWFDDPEPNISFLYNGTVGGGVFQRDYRFDELLFARNGGSEGLAQQVFHRDAGLKTLANVGISDSWMISAGISADVPGPVPILLYWDMAVHPALSSEGVQLGFSGGVALLAVRDVLEIYFPLVESRNILDSTTYEKRNRYFQRISFVFNLNNANPWKVIHQFIDN